MQDNVEAVIASISSTSEWLTVISAVITFVSIVVTGVSIFNARAYSKVKREYLQRTRAIRLAEFARQSEELTINVRNEFSKLSKGSSLKSVKDINEFVVKAEVVLHLLNIEQQRKMRSLMNSIKNKYSDPGTITSAIDEINVLLQEEKSKSEQAL